jgi:hypothetical protein
VLAVAHNGGDFRRDFLYLGRNHILYTHLGCFSAPGEAGGSSRAFDNAYHQSGFPIWQAVPDGLLALRFAPGRVGLGFA